MEKVARVLLAVDTAAAAAIAAPAAAELAAALRAPVVVAHIREAATDLPPEVGAEMEAEAMEYVDNVVDALRGDGIAAEPALRPAPAGETAEAIVAMAAEWSAGLIVMGSRGLSPLAGLFQGSVAHQVIQSAHCPVLVCPLQDQARPNQRLLERVVLALDNSPAAGRAAALLARLDGGGEIVLVHVREQRLADTLAAAAVGAAGSDRWQVPTEAEATALVQAPARSLEAAGFRVHARFPSGVHGSIAEQVLTVARTVRASMIVLGSRGRSDLAGAILGSVAYTVLRHARRPVLVVR